ncbi:MAG TPA: hypothetical protein QGH10_26210, partial [Armatimonadota bacterium]|nr:hypothetical protein [Armatimonadota bacterium]
MELEPRSWSNDGIGLNLRIKLYNEARVRHIKTPHISGDWYWDPSMGCCFDGEPGRNKQTFVYTVLSDRFPPPEVTAAEPDEEWFNLDDGPDGTYTLDCLNVDINTLAHEVGRRTGARIMVDESVKRRVTANLPEMTVPELLDGIAQAYGLALESQGGQWVFSQGLTTNVATYQTNVTQVVEVEHLSAQAALDLLPNFLLKYVKPSDAQNALIVAGPPQLVRRVREDVAKIDAPPQQIRIDVTAVKIAKAGAWQHQLEAYASHGQNSLYTNPATGSLSYDHLGDDSRDT